MGHTNARVEGRRGKVLASKLAAATLAGEGPAKQWSPGAAQARSGRVGKGYTGGLPEEGMGDRGHQRLPRAEERSCQRQARLRQGVMLCLAAPTAPRGGGRD